MSKKTEFKATSLEILKDDKHIGYAPICERKGMRPKGYLDDDGNPIVFKTPKEAREWVLAKETQQTQQAEDVISPGIKTLTKEGEFILAQKGVMTARDFLDEEKFGYDHFTKLTSTGISPDEDNIAEFAEDYHKSKLKDNMSKDKPNKGQVILFKAKGSNYPEIGVFKTYESAPDEIYIPAHDDVEKTENVEWWMEVPE